MILWRLHIRTAPDHWVDLPDTFEGDLEAVKRECRRIADERGQPVNAVLVDEYKAELIALAS